MQTRPDAKERPENTSDRTQEQAVEGTFPASDPLATTATQGSRAVPPEQLLGGGPAAAGSETLTRRFPDVETAKLALEALVREGPVEPSLCEVSHTEQGAELKITSPKGQEARLRDLLERHAKG